MLHVPLHITKVIDVGGVSLWVNNGISLAYTTATCMNSGNQQDDHAHENDCRHQSAPRVSGEPSGNNLILISKKRRYSVGKTQEQQKRLINR